MPTLRRVIQISRVLLRSLPLCLLFIVGACTQSQFAMTPEMRAQLAKTAEDLMMVDCLLPGQLRKLGSQATYLTARRPLKTSAVDCEIRGGEYVAFDRANYATALKVWLPIAEQGDPEAQTYVGEIYEKGLGLTPDYQMAALWYERAAKQSFSRAQINLGHLYEKGLGVSKDSAKALSFYRAASGLEEDQLAYASTIAAAHASEAELQRLKDLALQKDDEIRQLKQSLSKAQARLRQLQKDVNESNKQLLHIEEQLKKSKRSVSNAPDRGTEEAVLAQEVAMLKALLHDEQRRSDRELFAFTQEARALTDQKRLIIAALEEQLQRSRMALLEKRGVIAQLQQQSSAYQNSLQQMRQQEVLLAGAPVIEIIDPPMTLTRGRPTVRLRSAISEKEIIGKVVAPAGLASLKINEQPQEIDQYNLFWAKIPIVRVENPVEIVAIDKKGRRVSVDFALLSGLNADRPEHRPRRNDVTESSSAETFKANLKQAREALSLGRYYALVIGNNKYQHFPELETAVNDARETARILREQYGFETSLLIDADRYTLLSEFNRLRSELTRHDNLLIYYAGHGELDRLNERGYWLPVDAEKVSTTNWISNVAISDILNAMPAKHVMVVADSCYAGTLSTSSVARAALNMEPEVHTEWVKVMAGTRARTVLTSGGIAPVMDGGGGVHSVFANAFIKALRSNSGLMEGYGLYRQVLGQVRMRSAELQLEQIPDYAPIKHAGHEAGEFFFQSNTL